MHRIVLMFAMLICLGSPAWAQDPVKVDPKHYTVVVDNDQVRVIHTHIGPKESSPMHEHPASVVVAQTAAHLRFTLADGTTEDRTSAAGAVRFRPPIKHAVQNLDDSAVDVIEVELKANPAPVEAHMKKQKKKM